MVSPVFSILPSMLDQKGRWAMKILKFLLPNHQTRTCRVALGYSPEWKILHRFVLQQNHQPGDLHNKIRLLSLQSAWAGRFCIPWAWPPATCMLTIVPLKSCQSTKPARRQIMLYVAPESNWDRHPFSKTLKNNRYPHMDLKTW